jgi:hypothetical protein
MSKYDIKLNPVFRRIWKTLTMLIIPGLFSCTYAQSVDQGTNQKKNNEPDVHISVNRELDNNGNVTRYDSTYSWSWSSDGSQPVPQNFFLNDSNQIGFFDKNIFFDDSLINQSFNDPVFNNFEKQMQEMMQRQQQMMNEFFSQPPLSPAPEEKNDKKKEQKAPSKKTSGNGIDI